MEEFRCVMCQEIEDFVYVCDRSHLVCESCYDKSKTKPALCKCDNLLHSRKPNPITNNVREACEYSAAGCTWDFRPGDMKPHLKECRFRPYKCVGSTLNVWNCDWTGIQNDLENHFKSDHTELGDILKHKEESSLPFDPKTSMGTLNLINAFSRRFVFYFHTNSDNGMAYFCIFLLGKLTEAKRYAVDLTIFSKTKAHEKVEYKMICPSDVEDIRAMVADERFVAISHKSLKKYLDDESNIHFKFFVSLKGNAPSVVDKPPNSNNNPKNNSAGAQTKKGPPAKPALKGPMKPTNGTTKKSPPPAGPPPSSAGRAKPSDSSNNTRVTQLTNSFGNLFAPREPANAYGAQDDSNSVETAPACFSSAGARPPNKPVGLPMFQQPYKGVEQKYYRAKYPASSIQKPQLKK